MLKKMYDRMGEKIHSPFATAFLGFLFFIEAIFFLPVDPVLILYCLEKRNNAFWYATIALVFSVLGGITAYSIGFIIFETFGAQIINSKVISYIMSPRTFKHLCIYYEKYSSLAILVLGFSPLPYKAATLTAGFCKISFSPFVFFSIISRGARFFLIALVINLWGKQIKKYIDRYFNLLVVFILVIIITIILALM